MRQESFKKKREKMGVCGRESDFRWDPGLKRNSALTALHPAGRRWLFPGPFGQGEGLSTCPSSGLKRSFPFPPWPVSEKRLRKDRAVPSKEWVEISTNPLPSPGRDRRRSLPTSLINAAGRSVQLTKVRQFRPAFRPAPIGSQDA